MASRRYKTVNGIKTKEIDEATRKVIERAGNIDAQFMKAAELNVLDEKHYKKIFPVLKQVLIIYPPLLLFFFSYLTSLHA